MSAHLPKCTRKPAIDSANCCPEKDEQLFQQGLPTQAPQSDTAQAWIALGSNIVPRQHMPQALLHLAALGQISARSSLYRTLPWGELRQPAFLNGVICLRTCLSPEDILEALLALESALGRVRRRAHGPRTLDLDLLAWAAETRSTPRLRLPHPRLHERAFVLVPLAEIAPAWQHPTLGRSATQLLAGMDTAGIFREPCPAWDGQHNPATACGGLSPPTPPL